MLAEDPPTHSLFSSMKFKNSAAALNDLFLLERHSAALLSRALSEGLVQVFVNDQKVHACATMPTDVDWNHITTGLLLHDKVFLSDQDLDLKVKFPGGKPTISFNTQARPKKSLLNVFTDPPSVKDWVFPKVLQASHLFSVVENDHYRDFDIFRDFFRLELLLAQLVGKRLRRQAEEIGSALGLSADALSFIPNDRDLALGLGAYSLLWASKEIVDKTEHHNASLDSFHADMARNYQVFLKLCEYFRWGKDLHNRMRTEDFSFVLNLFFMNLLQYVPFYRGIIQHANESDATILADPSFTKLSDPLRNVHFAAEAVGIFRVVIGEGKPWRAPDMPLRDVLRIRNEPWAAGFRASIGKVIRAAENGDKDVARAARDEVVSSQERFRVAGGFEKVGSIVTYISVPMAIGEALLGSFVGGLSASLVSVTSLMIAKTLRKKAEWVVHLP